MKNTTSDIMSFGFFSELEKLGFISGGLKLAPLAFSALNAAGSRDGSGGSTGLTSNMAGVLSGSDNSALRLLGGARNAAAAFKKFRGGDEAYQPSANFTASAPPGQVAN